VGIRDRRTVRRFFLALTGALALVASGQASAGTDLTVTGDHRSGDYGTGTSQVSSSVGLLLVHGGRLQFHAFLPALRTESTAAVLWTGNGPAPIPPDQGGNGSGQGTGGQGAGGQGNGGPGSLVAGETSPATDTSTVVASGVGDLRVGLTARVLGKPAGLYRLDADVTVKAPTADVDKGLGTGEWDARLGVMGERRFWTFTAFGSVGWSRFGDPAWVDLADSVDFFGGVESEPMGPGLLLSGWIDANSEVVPGAGERMVVGGSLRRNRRNSWRVSVFAGLTEASEDFGVSLGFTWQGGTSRPRVVEVTR
jgi:hypothetical protein